MSPTAPTSELLTDSNFEAEPSRPVVEEPQQQEAASSGGAAASAMARPEEWKAEIDRAQTAQRMQIELEEGIHRQGDDIVLMSLPEVYRSYLEPRFNTDKDLYAVLMSGEVSIPIRTAPAWAGQTQGVRKGSRHWTSLPCFGSRKGCRGPH